MISYTDKVKEELSYKDTQDECCKKAACSAAIRLGGRFASKKNGRYHLVVKTRANTEARWLAFLLKELYSLNSDISMKKNRFNDARLYILKTEASYASSVAFSDLGLMEIDKNGLGLFCDIPEWTDSKHCIYSYYKGAFMSSGMMRNPEKGYTLEISSKNEPELDRLFKMLEAEPLLNVKKAIRRNTPYIYLSEAEDIVNFLNMTGAHNIMMDYENIRIEKGLRGDANRMLNCDEYNADKSVETKLRQIAAIRYIEKTEGLDILNDKLKEAALLRLNEDLTEYNEIAEHMVIKVSKSTVQKRYAKIEEIAEQLGFDKKRYKTYDTEDAK